MQPLLLVLWASWVTRVVLVSVSTSIAAMSALSAPTWLLIVRRSTTVMLISTGMERGLLIINSIIDRLRFKTQDKSTGLDINKSLTNFIRSFDESESEEEEPQEEDNENEEKKEDATEEKKESSQEGQNEEEEEDENNDNDDGYKVLDHDVVVWVYV